MLLVFNISSQSKIILEREEGKENKDRQTEEEDESSRKNEDSV